MAENMDTNQMGSSGIATSIAAIVMASGFSRRLGQNKLLLPLGDGTVVGQVLRQIGRLDFDPVVVVSQYDAVLAQADAMGFYPVANLHADESKSASIRLGLQTLEAISVMAHVPLPTGILFLTGDQVLLSDGLLRDLQAVFLEKPDSIVFPLYDGAMGSPGLFPVDMMPRLQALQGEEGGMKAAREQAHRIVTVTADPGWQGLDIDSADAWAKVKELYQETNTLRT